MVLRLTSLSLSSLLWVSMAWAGNTVFVNQSGNNVVINIEQIGDGNSVTGQNGTPVQLHGDNNTALVKQGAGNQHSGDSTLMLNVLGDDNYMDANQENGHWLDVLVLGVDNNVTVTQQESPNKAAIIDATGDLNAVVINQKGTGMMSTTVNLTGNGHTVNVVQDGTGNHAANISAHNAGGSSNIILDQNGNTNKSYSIDQYCANPMGCGVSIQQY